jgi:hypothetical protein
VLFFWAVDRGSQTCPKKGTLSPSSNSFYVKKWGQYVIGQFFHFGRPKEEEIDYSIGWHDSADLPKSKPKKEIPPGKYRYYNFTNYPPAVPKVSWE